MVTPISIDDDMSMVVRRFTEQPYRSHGTQLHHHINVIPSCPTYEEALWVACEVPLQVRRAYVSRTCLYVPFIPGVSVSGRYDIGLFQMLYQVLPPRTGSGAERQGDLLKVRRVLLCINCNCLGLVFGQDKLSHLCDYVGLFEPQVLQKLQRLLALDDLTPDCWELRLPRSGRNICIRFRAIKRYNMLPVLKTYDWTISELPHL